MPSFDGTIQICRRCAGRSREALNSACTMPVPALIFWISPGRMIEPLPSESLCCNAPDENVGHDLHVAMGMGLEAAAARNDVFIDDAQRPETHMIGIAVIAEGKCVTAVEPVDFRLTPRSSALRSVSMSNLSATFLAALDGVPDQLAMSAPPKRLTSRMPVGEVTLISVR